MSLEAFQQSAPLTLGVELELQLVTPTTTIWRPTPKTCCA